MSIKSLIVLIIITSFTKITTAQEIATKDEVNFEIGAGVNYGGGIIGGTVSREVTPNLELFAAVGAFVDVGYTVGGRYYVDENIRLTLNYGTNSYLEVTELDGTNDYENFAGVNFGIGWINSKQGGFNIDLMYISTDNLDDRVDELEKQGYQVDEDSGKVKLSLGYRF